MYTSVMSAIRSFFTYLWGLPKLYTIPAALAVVAVAGGLFVATRGTGEQNISEGSRTNHVATLAVADYVSGAGGAFAPSADGNSFVVRAEVGGKVTRTASIGSRVAAGQTIVMLENAAQAAAVTQAEGNYDAARAALEKLSGTTVANTGITSAQAQASAQNAATAASTALKSAYASLDDAVHAKTDPFFGSPRSTSPKLLAYTVPDSQLVANIENARATLEPVLAHAQEIANKTERTDIDADIIAMSADAQTILGFIDDVVEAMNQAVPNPTYTAATIAANQTAAGAARTEVVTAISNLTTTKGTYDAAISSAATAANSATTGSQSDIAAAEANLKAAQGALDSARAALGKTVIRAPFVGTLSSVSVAVGDVISASVDVAIIVPAKGAETDRSWSLPLAAVKYTPSAAYVFTVGEDGVLAAHEVQTGLVTKDRIAVTGLLGDEVIVADVRGMKAGDTVSADE